MTNHGELDLGLGVRLEGCDFFVDPSAKFKIGDFTTFGSGTRVNASDKIKIGSNCSISWGVDLLDTNFHDIQRSTGQLLPKTKPISIGDHILVSMRSLILPGTQIGDSVVGAGSVLTGKEFPANSMIVKNPAKVIDSPIEWFR